MLFLLSPGNRIALLVFMFAAIFKIPANAEAQENSESFVSPQIPGQEDEQLPTSSADDTTVTYPAEFFTQYEPISARDMLNRIPGIDSILGGGGGNNDNRRGLGAGDNQILINGKRVAGKENDGRSVLAQIAASQVRHIEIIRGTSSELDIRSAGPIVNVLLRENASKATYTAEINADYYQQDGHVQPGAIFSVNGRGDTLNYLATVEAEPRYEQEERREFSVLGDGSPKDQTYENRVREQTNYKLNTTLGWHASDKDLLQLNALFEKNDPPRTVERDISVFDPNDTRIPLLGGRTTYHHFDDDDAERHKWEFGFNYAHTMAPATQLKLIGIANEEITTSLFERFSDLSGNPAKITFINDQRRYRERILRGAYVWPLSDNFDIESGLEWAQTTLDSNFILGSTSGWNPSPRFGGLRGSSDEESEVQEVRYEPFIVTNWRPTNSLAIEASLVAEVSEITLDGYTYSDADDDDIPELNLLGKQDDYEFWRPKLDIRYDISNQLQFRTTINRDISQLDFRDYTSRQDGDLDSDVDVGNPDLVQEKTWQYEFNLEYRLPNDGGVLNGRVYYHDIEDVIDRVNVSTTVIDPVTNQPEQIILSAPGNIGDGERYGLEIDSSIRLGFLDMPEALLTAGIFLQDSEVTDPFLGESRRLAGPGRGNWNIGFRHDVTEWNLNYGFNYRYFIKGNNRRIDVDDIRNFERDAASSLFIEKVAFQGIRFRFDVMNALDGQRCLTRTRYAGFTVDGVVDEVEASCVGPGRKISLKIRTTF